MHIMHLDTATVCIYGSGGVAVDNAIRHIALGCCDMKWCVLPRCLCRAGSTT